MKHILDNTLTAHAQHLADKDYSALELTRACLEAIEAREETVGAFLTVDAEGALLAARASDERRARGEERGALDGIPYALKDNICVRDMRLTCASRILENYVSPYDATVTERLRDAGAVLLGKTNMDEFAMGSSSAYSALGTTTNPCDASRTPGGSSGGSAAAVAAREAVFSLGTDTGGSVRQPAAFCGVYGLKPTYGVLSRFGVAAMATSLDCVGIMARAAADASAVLEALTGRDARDATSIDYVACPDVLSRPLRIGVVEELSSEHVSADVRACMERAIALLREAGARIETVSLPLPKQALASYTVLCATEAASNLARYDGVRYGYRGEDGGDLEALYANTRSLFGEEVKRRILFGTDMLSRENRERYYVRACRVRELITERMRVLFDSVDLLLTPTAPTVAFACDERPSPEALYYADLCTVYASLAGFPALSVPFGQNGDGLPLSVQLTAKPLCERLLFGTARLFEEAEHEC